MRQPAVTRAEGVLLAAAAGDALGWPQETRSRIAGGKRARDTRKPRAAFSSWVRNGGTRYLPYEDPIGAGEYSDDTQLLLAVARACLAGDSWLDQLTRVELPAWPYYQRGGGRAVLAAAAAWDEHRPPWESSHRTDGPKRVEDYFKAGANGVAMRIAPHVLWAVAHDRPWMELAERVIRDGILTHGHPRALVGALAYASALRTTLISGPMLTASDLPTAAIDTLVDPEFALQLMPANWFGDGRPADGFAHAWHRTNLEIRHLLELALRSLRQGSMSDVRGTLDALGAFGPEQGSGVVTAASAIYVASRAGSNPVSGLVEAAYSTGADTDTLASMVGGLLGGTHGTEWLGPLTQVQDAGYVRRIARSLHAREPMEVGRDRVPDRVVTRALEDEGARHGHFVDGRPYEVRATQGLSENPWVLRFHLELIDGQTVVVDRVHRNPPRTAVPTRTLTAALAPSSPAPKLADSERSRSAPEEIHPGVRVFISLHSADLDATEQFYSALLDEHVTRDRRTIVIGDALEFIGDDAPDLLGSDAAVRLSVRDLDVIANRTGTPIERSAEQRLLRLTDPDGRQVTIFESA